MSIKATYESSRLAKAAGWFSRRHRTSQAMHDHRDHYRVHRGANGRRLRAQQRAEIATLAR